MALIGKYPLNTYSLTIRDFLSIIFLSIVVYTFSIYRLLIIKEFVNILKLYFILLVIFSLISSSMIEISDPSLI
mgnify:CR=1 FL=1